MRILITGGSGTVGQELLQLLFNSGNHEIIAFDTFSKNSEKIYQKFRDGIQVHYGDIRNKADVEKVCDDIDAVIHLAAIIPPLADQDPLLAQQVNTGGTRNLLEALKKGSPNAFFLYGSSVSVYGDRLLDFNIKVGDALQPSEGDEYARTKIEAENLVIQSALDWTIFRISAVMGVNNHKVTGLMFHMPLATKIEIITPKDVAFAFFKGLFKRDELKNRIFNLGGGEKCRTTYNKFLSKNFEIIGLGDINFPKHAFATHNFHCGYYEDSDELNNILNFQRDTLEDYFKDLKNATPKWRFYILKMFKKFIREYLLKKSEPYHALSTENTLLMKRFFKKDES